MLFTVDSLNKVNLMVKVNIYGEMGKNMMDSGGMGKDMVLDYGSVRLDNLMREIGVWANLKDTAPIPLSQVTYMKVNLRILSVTAKVSKNSQTAICTEAPT